MIWLEIYVVGLAFLLGVFVGEGGRHSRLEAGTAILWPIAVPVALVCRQWNRRQVRRWYSLTMRQRQALNAAGKGVKANHWPYRHAPWVPRGTKRELELPPTVGSP